MKSKIIVAIVCLVSIFQANGQSNNSVEGLVKDSASRKGLAYATAILYKKGNTQPLKSTYTSSTGKFQFSRIDTGKYELGITHTGYQMRRIMLTITQEKKEEILQDILLAEASKQLGNVTVTAVKPLVEQTDDKIVYNTENDPAAKTETAIDILRKTPFVSVDGDNNVQVNGQSNFKVLLNGKETAMFSQNVKEALKGFPGAVISKIEVITSPSAKYDAEGIGGIINIVTRKKVVGYNGVITAFANTNNGTGVNGNLSVKSGKLGISAFYSANRSKNLAGSSLIETQPKISSFYTRRSIQGKRLSNYFYNFGNMELSWELDSLHTVSIYGNISGGNNQNDQDQNIITELSNPVSSVSNIYNTQAVFEYPSYNVGTDFIKKFKSNPEKELDLKFFGEFSDNNSLNNSQQLSSSGNRFVSNNNMSNNKQYTLVADFILPIKQGQKLESGIKGIFRSAIADFQSLITYDMNKPFAANPLNSNYFRYTQNIVSAYASYNFKIKKYSLRLGTRLENTNINGNFISSGSVVNQNYTNVIPNIQVTKKLSPSFTGVLSYTMRLQRPFITSLNPFVSNNDSLNISYGNPNLGPQTIQSVSFQSRIQKGSTFLGITLLGSYSNNAIQSFTTFDASKGVISTTSSNIGREYLLGLNSNVSTKFSNIWRLTVNGAVNYNYAKNKYNLSQTNSGISGNAFMGNNLIFNSKFSVGSYIGFFAFPVSIQTKRSIQYFYNVTAAYKIIKEKVNISLSLQNFLSKELTFRSTTLDPNFTMISQFTNPFRAVSVSIGYNFGKLTENVSKKKGVVNDDLVPASGN